MGFLARRYAQTNRMAREYPDTVRLRLTQQTLMLIAKRRLEMASQINRLATTALALLNAQHVLQCQDKDSLKDIYSMIRSFLKNRQLL